MKSEICLSTGRPRALEVWLAFVLSFGATLPGQTLADVRDELRQSVRAARYSTFLAAFLGLTEEATLSGAGFRVEQKTNFSVLTYPVKQRFDLGEGAPRLLLEGEVGFATARIDYPDIYEGALPGFETRVTSRYQTYGGIVGAGLEVPCGDFRLTPVALVGLSRVENKTIYGGPGADLTRSLTDGILFNWDATYAAYGGALTAQHDGWQWREVRLRPELRYDYRRTDPLAVDDASQGGTVDLHWAVARIEADGPLGWRWGDREVRWLGSLGYKRFFGQGGDQLGFDDYYELGAGFVWDCHDIVPALGQLGLRGALVIGDGIRGWTFGAVLRF